MSQPYYQQPGYHPPRRTNSMAIASLITAFVFAPVAVALGIIARRQIRETGEEGWGMATAGLIIGVVLTVLGVLAFVLWVVMVVWLFNTGGNIPVTR